MQYAGHNSRKSNFLVYLDTKLSTLRISDSEAICFQSAKVRSQLACFALPGLPSIEDMVR